MPGLAQLVGQSGRFLGIAYSVLLIPGEAYSCQRDTLELEDTSIARCWIATSSTT